MKYGRLKQICKMCRRYRNLGLCCFIPAIILVALCIVARLDSEQINDVFLGSTLIAGFVTIVVSIVFSRLEAKWYRMATTYVEIKIMDVINDFGIDSNNFVLIQDGPVRYKVGFHNQMIDYELLQSELDEKLAIMNKITGWVTKVELI